MVGIGAGPEHCLERPTGGGADGVLEFRLRRTGGLRLDADLLALVEDEGGDVDRAAAGVLGNALLARPRPADIGRGMTELGELALGQIGRASCRERVSSVV